MSYCRLLHSRSNSLLVNSVNVSNKHNRQSVGFFNYSNDVKKSGKKDTETEVRDTHIHDDGVAEWIKKLHASDKYRPPIVAKYRRQNYSGPVDRTIGILTDDAKILWHNTKFILKQVYNLFFNRKELQEQHEQLLKKYQQENKSPSNDAAAESSAQLSSHLSSVIDNKLNAPKKKKSSIRDMFRLPPQPDIFPNHCDVVIIGGGAVGASIAYHLRKNVTGDFHIVMLEKDTTYKEASTVLSVGGIRHQFSLPENILLSMYGMQFMQDIPRLLEIEGFPTPNINFQPHGYLTLASDEGLKQLQENFYVQNYFNARVEFLQRSDLKRKFPWMNLDGIAAGVLGVENEGWFDPWSLLMALRQKVINMGVDCVEGELVGCQLEDKNYERFTDGHRSNSEQRIKSIEVKQKDGTVSTIHPAIVVMATGHNTGRLCHDLLGIGAAREGLMAYPVPIEPRKRYVYCFHAPKGPGLATPLVVDPSGAYFRREGFGNMFLCGMSPPEHEEPPCHNLEVDHDYFIEKVWPVLANRVPAFDELKVQGSWAGFYEQNIFDQNGIIGTHPIVLNMILASGFSGHGIQHSLGVGRAVMELIYEGEFQSVDLSRFGFERLFLNEPVYEAGIV